MSIEAPYILYLPCLCVRLHFDLPWFSFCLITKSLTEEGLFYKLLIDFKNTLNCGLICLDTATPMAYNYHVEVIRCMVIVETSVFTRQVQALLNDDIYRHLQTILVIRPDAGNLIPGGGGLRKVRWSASGRGKRGGVRVIYYWAVQQERILMLLMYAKNEQDNLTEEQLKVLRRIIQEEYP